MHAGGHGDSLTEPLLDESDDTGDINTCKPKPRNYIFVLRSVVSLEDATDSMCKAAALWILKTREVQKIPLSVMDNIISDVQGLFQSALSHLHQHTRNILPAENYVALDSAFSEHSPFVNIFDGLRTQQQQLTYLRKEFRMVARAHDL
jgi:hypothetical protein